MVKCAAFNERGEPCGAEAAWDTPWCVSHQPTAEGKEFHRQISRRGGQSAHTTVEAVDIPIDTSSADGILRSLEALGKALAHGDIDRSRASALSFILATAVAAQKALRHEERLKRIERVLDIHQSPLEDTEDHGEG